MSHLTEEEKLICWQLLDLEILLKEDNLTSEQVKQAIKILKNIPERFLKTELIEFFFVKNTRRCIKKIEQSEFEKMNGLIKMIADTFNNRNLITNITYNSEHVLKLLISCKERGFNLQGQFSAFIDHLYSEFRVAVEINSDEFIFVDCEIRKKCQSQRCLRYLILLDTVEGLKRTCEGVDDKYWFELMSFNDSELIKFMKGLFYGSQSRFFEFYSFIIAKDLISVDFIVDQLVTDSPVLVELLLAVFGASSKTIGPKFRAHFKNFHVLLGLKLELSFHEFPFKCQILQKKLDKFINTI